ncbi:MAG: hypothetical protein RBU37_19130 [Myxococcota bacterium]|jgi:hypothetical protein|nr:hypothetical protein [Myxococcota bacterium]
MWNNFGKQAKCPIDKKFVLIGRSPWSPNFLRAVGLSLFVAALSMAAPAYADDFDFSDDGGTDDGGDDGGFDFTDGTEDTSVGTQESQRVYTFEAPPTDKPAIGVFFDTIDPVVVDEMDELTDTLLEHMSEFNDYYVVDALVLRSRLDEIDPDRSNCTFEPACLSDLAREYKLEKLVIGRFVTENVPRPRMTLELYDVPNSILGNLVEYDASSRSKSRKRELRPAAYKLLNREMPKDDSLSLLTQIDNTPQLATWQVVSAISCGVVGLGLVGTGVAFGVMASGTESDLMDGRSKRNITQKEAEALLDDAKGQALMSNVMYGVGGVVLVVGAVLLVIRPDEEIDTGVNKRAEIDFFVEPTFGADGAGLIGGLRF